MVRAVALVRRKCTHKRTRQPRGELPPEATDRLEVAKLSTTNPRVRTAVLAAMIVTLFLTQIPPAHAADGQVIGGDGNVASHVTDAGSNARVTFDAGSVLNDCPTGLGTCVMEYKWRSRKDCAICWWSDDTPWIVLPAGTTTINHCDATGNFRFELKVRLRWNASTTKTVETWGKYEQMYQVDVSTLVTRLFAAAVFNVTNNAGYRASVLIETNTATSDYSDPYTIATSGSSYISTSC